MELVDRARLRVVRVDVELELVRVDERLRDGVHSV